ncbi:MAG: hypothetical protein LBJ32_01305, partial [Oscillospiraceae bacterium]|nr:hypothetical protein [Oscillospiraceae bacterium]
NKASPIIFESSRINIFEVSYVETDIDIQANIDNFDSYQEVHNKISECLKKFLNPVNGNFSNLGWSIGNLPRENDVHNSIKPSNGLKWINKINIFYKVITENGKIEISKKKVKNLKFMVPIPGIITINLDVNEA